MFYEWNRYYRYLFSPLDFYRQGQSRRPPPLTFYVRSWVWEPQHAPLEAVYGHD